MKKTDNNFKKLNKRELKTIQGGNIPVVPIAATAGILKPDAAENGIGNIRKTQLVFSLFLYFEPQQLISEI
ncbi:class IIb bacteriocin, lactobin A/cerein 7B family [Chryseobacterium arthrosphaerae]|uniref:class IIb bacteriocin, lactobin A/cerein 7B family n=1 Tax=Chryseobacterium arthrosphaerae TaxID=651561 RepID=UPI003D33935F